MRHIHADNMAKMSWIELMFVLVLTLETTTLRALPTDDTVVKYSENVEKWKKCGVPESFVFLHTPIFDGCKSNVDSSVQNVCNQVYQLTDVICKDQNEDRHANLNNKFRESLDKAKDLEPVCGRMLKNVNMQKGLNGQDQCNKTCTEEFQSVCEFLLLEVEYLAEPAATGSGSKGPSDRKKTVTEPAVIVNGSKGPSDEKKTDAGGTAIDSGTVGGPENEETDLTSSGKETDKTAGTVPDGGIGTGNADADKTRGPTGDTGVPDGKLGAGDASDNKATGAAEASVRKTVDPSAARTGSTGSPVTDSIGGVAKKISINGTTDSTPKTSSIPVATGDQGSGSKVVDVIDGGKTDNVDGGGAGKTDGLTDKASVAKTADTSSGSSDAVRKDGSETGSAVTAFKDDVGLGNTGTSSETGTSSDDSNNKVSTADSVMEINRSHGDKSGTDLSDIDVDTSVRIDTDSAVDGSRLKNKAPASGDQLSTGGKVYDGPSSGNFMAYFLTAVVVCIAGYVVFHNKQKIFAFIIEGRTSHARRRVNGGGEYKKLQSNVEEVMPALDKSTSAKNFIY